jgi:proton-coupled amino acid transporter
MRVDNPDPEVVRVVGRHLVRDSDVDPSLADNDGQFDSLKLQGGDITRQLYKWQKDHETDSISRGRSKSFDLPREGGQDEGLNIQNIKVPGGMRRSFLSAKAQAQSQTGPPTFLTRNFIEFLSIYGHFAGEELEEEEDEYSENAIEEEGHPDENTALLSSSFKVKRPAAGKATATKAVLLLLKSFVGTGVLFLPKAYYNGGILFSSLVLIFVSALSYWCFLLLIRARIAVGVSSFGDIGGALYGEGMRKVILFSIVISQIGFAAAYIVFTSENLQALILALTKQKTLVNIETLIFLQLFIFLPLSMIRNIAKLSGTALIADFFILLGLLYLYYWGGLTIATQGISDVKLFNPKDWTLFIGTAIFTFEGIGLIIPIQESMKKPKQFGPVLAGVMIGITLIFVSMGALCYAAYGSNVKTVVILNLPQDSKFVNGVQLLYSLAILLSTPLQLFPAIRILENGLFIRSGKHNPTIKWQKNVFRFFLVFFTALVAWGGADDLDKFVALIGSFACIPLVYVYPPLLHLKSVAQTSVSKLADVLLIIFGTGCMVYTTYGTVTRWIGSS